MTLRKSAALAPAVGLLLGAVIGYVDSRPTWDDTGITVGAVLHGGYASAAAVGIGLVGAGAGYAAGKLLRTLDPTTHS